MHARREELAAAAARLIVEDGLDYAAAKRKAARQLLGAGAHVDAQSLPDNTLVREHVEQYLALFHAEDHPAVLRRLRRAALSLMQEFADFRPHLSGAVWNGTATAHSGLHVMLFCDEAKDVEIHCINRNIPYRVSQAAHYAGRGQVVERLEFSWPLPGAEAGAPEWVDASLSLYRMKDERGVLRPVTRGGPPERGTLQAVRALIEADASAAP